MCHESTSDRAGARRSASARPASRCDDVHQRQAAGPGRAEPGHQPPADAVGAGDRPSGNGAKIIAINPLREAGLVNFRNPQHPRGIVGRGTDLADLHLPIKINGDLALFQALGALLLEWGAIDNDFVDPLHPRFRGLARPRPRRWTGTRSIAITGLTREQITAGGAAAPRLRRHGLLLGDGADPAPQRGGHHQGDRQPGLAAGQHRQAGRRPAAGARPLQRAGRPDDGHLGAAAAALPGSAAGRVRLRPAARARATTPSTRSGRCGTASARVFIGLGGNFVQAAPDTEVTIDALRRARADRAGLDQDQPLAPGLRRDRADPAHPGPDRDGRPGQRAAVRLGGGLDLLGARLARAAAAGQPAAALRGGHRHRICRGDPGRPVRHRLAGDAGRLPGDPHGTSPGWCPACEGYEVKVDRPGGFVLPHPPRDSRTFHTASGRAEFTVSPIEPLEVPPGHLVLQTLRSHDQFNTTIYGLSDRYRGIEGGRRVVFVQLRRPGRARLRGGRDGRPGQPLAR